VAYRCEDCGEEVVKAVSRAREHSTLVWPLSIARPHRRDDAAAIIQDADT
jgi:hypothetical protein